jgi:hypothetical protein
MRHGVPPPPPHPTTTPPPQQRPPPTPSRPPPPPPHPVCLIMRRILAAKIADSSFFFFVQGFLQKRGKMNENCLFFIYLFKYHMISLRFLKILTPRKFFPPFPMSLKRLPWNLFLGGGQFPRLGR